MSTATDEDRRRGGVGRAAAKGVAWNTLGSVGDRLIGFVALAIVVRLMRVDEAGVVMLATTLFELVMVVSQAGFGDRVIQHPAPDRRLIGTVYWTHMGLCAVAMALFFLAAPGVAALFGEPRLVPLLQVMSALLVTRAIANLPSALLAREMKFRAFTLAGMAAGLTGAAGGIGVALAGHPMWAVTVQLLVASLVFPALIFRAARWLPPLCFSGTEAWRTLGFALPLVGSAALTNAAQQVSTLLIGFFLPIEQVAVFRLAARLFDVMSHMLVLPVQRVLLTSFARMHHDRARLTDAFLNLLRVTAALACGAYGLVAGQGTAVMSILFGPAWSASGLVLALLALGAPGLVMRAFAAPSLVTVGRTRMVLAFTVATTLVLMALVSLATQSSVEAVAAAQTLTLWLTVPLSLWAFHLAFRVPRREALLTLPQPVLAGLAGAGASFAAAAFLARGWPEAPLLARTFAAGVPGAAAFVAAHFAAGPRRTLSTLRAVLALVRRPPAPAA